MNQTKEIVRTEDYFRELLLIFFAQKTLILWTTVIIFISSILVAFFWPPSYSATGSILVTGKSIEKSPEAIEEVGLRIFPLTKEDLYSELQILMSHDVIEKTIQDLEDKGLYKTPGTDTDMSEQITMIHSKIDTKVLPASNVIEVAYLNNDYKYATSLLDSLIDQYVVYRMELSNPREAEIFFSQQADIFRANLEAMEDELMAIVETNNVSDPLRESEKNIALKKDLEQQLNTYSTQAVEKELAIGNLEAAIKSNNIQYYSFIENKPVINLSNRIKDLQIERGKKLRDYHPLSAKIKLLEKQTLETVALLTVEVKAYKESETRRLAILRGTINSIQDRIKYLDTRNVELHKQFMNAKRVQREAILLNASYETFSKRKEEARIKSRINANGLSSNVSILSRAFSTGKPVFPNKNVVIPLGLLVGFITGCSFGFMREYFDHSFKKPGDVQKYAGLPVILSIPDGAVRY